MPEATAKPSQPVEKWQEDTIDLKTVKTGNAESEMMNGPTTTHVTLPPPPGIEQPKPDVIEELPNFGNYFPEDHKAKLTLRNGRLVK